METSLLVLRYLAALSFASRRMMQGEKDGTGLFPLFVSPGGCLHVGCLRAFFFFFSSFCLLRRCLVSIV